jgi:hypothetical protein
MPGEPPDSRSFHVQLRREATLLAGGIHDLAQRATVYHHIFEHSGGNHVFPLLAAHGALWARSFFRLGMRVGSAVSLRYAMSPLTRQAMTGRLVAFADAFRDINRRVCVETYTVYHLTGDPRLLHLAERHVPPDLLDPMIRCHIARRVGRSLSDNEMRALFTAFFLWEQANIVGPSVDLAVTRFDWPLVKALAMRPTIRFAYFPNRLSLPFKDFADISERIERGLQAFDAGLLVGWPEVEYALRRYQVMPNEFFKNSAAHFRDMRLALSAGAQGPQAASF